MKNISKKNSYNQSKKTDDIVKKNQTLATFVIDKS